MRLALPLLLLLAACGGDNPDKRSTPAESKLTDKAVADVTGAMQDATQAPPAPAKPASPAP